MQPADDEPRDDPADGAEHADARETRLPGSSSGGTTASWSAPASACSRACRRAAPGRTRRSRSASTRRTAARRPTRCSTARIRSVGEEAVGDHADEERRDDRRQRRGAVGEPALLRRRTAASSAGTCPSSRTTPPRRSTGGTSSPRASDGRTGHRRAGSRQCSVRRNVANGRRYSSVRTLMLLERDLVAVVLERDAARLRHAVAGHALNLLSRPASFQSALHSSYSTDLHAVQPVLDVRTLTTRRALFHSPAGLRPTRASAGEGVVGAGRSDRARSCASGWPSLSISWNSGAL